MADAPLVDKKLSVFISYSRRDSTSADQLVEALLARGFAVTIDRRDLEFGEKWQAELADFIRLCDTVIWLVSEASIRSEWVNWELDEVARRTKRLVPVMVGDTPRDKLPRQIGEIHILPATGVFDLRHDVDALVRVLETDRAWLKEASRLGDRAYEWTSRNRTPALLLRGAALTAAEQWKDRRPDKAPPPAQEVVDLMHASRRAATSRQRWWVGGSLGVAVGAVALAGLAYVQTLEADRQRVAAVANEAKAVEQEKIAVVERDRAQKNEDRATRERDQALISQSRTLIERAAQAKSRGAADTAALLALEALPAPDDWQSRPFVQPAERALWEATNADRLIRHAPLTKRGYVLAGTANALAIAEPDGSISVARATTSETSRRLEIDTQVLAPLAFAPHSTVLLARSSSGLSLWNTAKGTPSARTPGDLFTASAAFCPDDSKIVLLSSGGELQFWTPESGALDSRGKSDDLSFATISCSPDGTKVIAYALGFGVALWDAGSGRQLGKFGSEFATWAPVFSADSRRILLLSTDTQETPLLIGGEGQIVAQLTGHARGVASWRFSADSRWLVTSADDTDVIIWDAATGKPVHVLKHPAGLTADIDIRVLKDGRLRVLTGAADEIVRVWDGDSGRQLIAFPGDVGRFATTAFEPADDDPAPQDPADAEEPPLRVLAAGRSGQVGVWIIPKTGEPERQFTLRMPAENGLTSAHFSASGTSVIGIDDNKALAVWSLRATGEAWLLAVSTDGALVARSRQRAIVVEEVATGRQRASLTLKGHTDAVGLIAAFTPDGQKLITASTSTTDRSARLWDLATNSVVRMIAAGDSPIATLALSRDGTRLAVATRTPAVIVYDVASGSQLTTLETVAARAVALAWSPDGHQIAVGYLGQGGLVIGDGETGRVVRSLASKTGVSAVDFSPDGQWLASMDFERRLTIWSTSGYDRVFDLTLTNERLTGPRLRFDPSSARLVAGGSVIDVAGRSLVLEGSTGDLIRASPFFTGGGQRTVTGGIATIGTQPFHHDAQSLVRFARERALRCLTPDERRHSFLTDAPPAWCVERRLWPYQSEAWRTWLTARKAGQEPALPLD